MCGSGLWMGGVDGGVKRGVKGGVKKSVKGGVHLRRELEEGMQV